MAAERFLQLTDVAEILNISSSQTYALVRSGDLPAIKIGGRGQWRVERTVLERHETNLTHRRCTAALTEPVLGQVEMVLRDPVQRAGHQRAVDQTQGHSGAAAGQSAQRPAQVQPLGHRAVVRGG